MYYAKNVKLHKGVDNPIKFRIKNQNQKNVDVTGNEFRLYITDVMTSAEILNRTLTLEDAEAGLVSTVITENDLNDFTLVRYHYGIKMIDSNGDEQPIYVDDNYSATGVIEVSDTAYPNRSVSTELTIPSYSDDVGVTSTITINSIKNNTHTVAYYLTGFTGTVTVQGHLEDSSAVSESDYIDITTNSYTDITGVVYTNFTGLFRGIRFKVTRTAGSVDRILHKN